MRNLNVDVNISVPEKLIICTITTTLMDQHESLLTI